MLSGDLPADASSSASSCWSTCEKLSCRTVSSLRFLAMGSGIFWDVDVEQKSARVVQAGCRKLRKQRQRIRACPTRCLHSRVRNVWRLGWLRRSPPGSCHPLSALRLSSQPTSLPPQYPFFLQPSSSSSSTMRILTSVRRLPGRAPAHPTFRRCMASQLPSSGVLPFAPPNEDAADDRHQLRFE
jgi:hypothetical protein